MLIFKGRKVNKYFGPISSVCNFIMKYLNQLTSGKDSLIRSKVTECNLMGAIPLCCNTRVIFYYRPKTQQILISNVSILFYILGKIFRL